MLPEHPPQRRGDLSLRQDARRALVQQRLEHVLGCAVDERDRERTAAQCPGREQPGEAAADDDHPCGRVLLIHCAPPVRRCRLR